MVRNLGRLDRAIRITVGLLLFSQVFVGLQTLWGLVGVIPLFNGLVGW
ncbi:MAG: DUF2892 domain-containing protein [Deltaproteobacteria bacterium]|nr:DUF2892 domain-containing protein [Deltaproteobacteria bacterium]